MIPHCDFDEQVVVRSVVSVQKPDMIVHLPGNGAIVVDAKTPISAFIESIEAENDVDRQACLNRHVSQIEDQVRNLSAKNYQDQFERSPDFVILFIPGESFLQAAVQLKSNLIEWAMNQNVIIAAPTTLISLLKAVAMGWREEQVAQSAKHIEELGNELCERIAKIAEYALDLGSHLKRAVGSYDKFIISLESRVLVTTRKFKELGVDSAKKIPAESEVKPIEAQPRQLKTAHSETAIETT